MQDSASSSSSTWMSRRPARHKTIAGQNAREFVLTITMRQNGKKLEESGGMVHDEQRLARAARRGTRRDGRVQHEVRQGGVYGGTFAGMDPQQLTAALSDAFRARAP